ncbi:MAG: ATP-binding protein [Verrucomicrobia subdivision 3 bacterium]|nr:ATP-binding protein [Limisphaerales bacterium]
MHESRSYWMTYGVAVVSVAVALVLSDLLEPFLGDARPYLAVLGAVVVSLWYGGWRPAAFAAMIGYLGTAYLFIMPRNKGGVPTSDFAEELAAYLVSCGVVISLGELWHRAQRRAEQHRKSLEEEIAERKETEQRLIANLAIAQILAESPQLEDAVPRVLQKVGETLRWQVGAVWIPDADERILRCLKMWKAFPDKFARFEAVSSGRTFRPGIGLPGRVWSTLKPVWIPDVTRDDNFPRGLVASAEGLHAGLAFPIYGEKFLGIMEFFSDEIRAPDEALLAMFGVIGGQIGQFIERKRAEEALQQAQAELKQHATKLEQVVAQRTARLRETVQELEAFSYSIAHDMRAPLRAMQGFAGILKQDYGDKLDDTAQGYLQRLGSAAARMDRLIVDILNYSQVVREELDLGVVDTHKLLLDIIHSYPQFDHAHADISIEGRLPLVLANEAALTQVMSNLLGNAVKFVTPGVRPCVRVGANPEVVDDGRVELWVQDNGIGIPRDVQKRLFNMFTRLHRPGLYEGTGIGLAIVKKAVERMGGSVGVESNPGEGSRFWVQLRRPVQQ